MYKSLVRPFLFNFDPESVHHFSFNALETGFALPGVRELLTSQYTFQHPSLEREVFGLKFKNPVGLAAGFDKDAVLAAHWHRLGFGFVEIGTVTPRPQAGNPKQRLFRLPADKAVINRMGFNNGGVEAAVTRLRDIDRSDLIIGANIGKNKDTPNAEAFKDYEICFEALFPHVDYFVANVSSPNTPGLRELQEKKPLTELLLRVQALNQAKAKSKPLLLKIAPDLTNAQLDDIIAVAHEAELDGIIATNTTISRAGLKTPAAEVEAIGAGGLSGAPVRARAQEVCAYLHAQAPTLPLIGVGGITTAADARARLDAGASLVQGYTGFIYEGPGYASNICRGLVQGQ